MNRNYKASQLMEENEEWRESYMRSSTNIGLVTCKNQLILDQSEKREVEIAGILEKKG